MKHHQPRINAIRKCLPIMLCLVVLLFVSTAIADSALPAPQNLHSTGKTTSSITLSWDSVSGASYYRFYQNGSFLCTVSGTSYTASGLTANTVYGFKVCAVDSFDTLGAYSSNIYIRTEAPFTDPPLNLRATATTSTSITLAWSGVSGASYYRFYQNGVFKTKVSGTSYTTTGLTQNTIYLFKVAAVNSNGTLSPYSGNVAIRTKQGPPAAPANLRAASKTTSAITMAWNAVPGASYYRFYKNGSYVGKVTASSYTCTGLTANTIYGFKVAAVDSGGMMSAYSGNVYIRTEAPFEDPPLNLRATTTTSTSITMAWGSVSGASYYRFYKNGKFITKVTGTSYTAAGLTQNTIYIFKVAAVNSNGTLSPYSANVSVRTKQGPPAAPANLHAALTTADAITMTWNSVPGADYYRFYKNGRYIGKVNGTSYTCKELTASTVYGFKVAAVDSGGMMSAYSGNVYIRTAPPFTNPPSNLRATETTTTSVTMAWNSVSGASYYRFYKNGIFITKVWGTSYTITDLTQNTGFIFKVAAVNGSGTLSPYSDNVYVLTKEGTPDAPTNLRATHVVSDFITMTWDSVPGVSYYRVYRNGLWIRIPCYDTSYTFKYLNQNVVYGFKVAAVTPNGFVGQFTPNVYVRTLLDAPQNLHITTEMYNAIGLEWNAVAGAAYYKIYQNGTYAGKATETTYTCTGLNKNTMYEFRVAAVSTQGNLGEYCKITVQTLMSDIAAPQNLRLVERSATTVTMTWDMVAGASYYRFYVDDSYDGQTSSTSYTVTGLTENTVYDFKVVGVNDSDDLGLYSDTVHIRTDGPPLAAPILSGISNTAGSVSLSWDPVEGAKHYRVYKNGVFVEATQESTYFCSGLTPDTVYGFKVAAVSVTDKLGNYSDNIYVRTRKRLPAPQNLHAIAITINSIKLRWDFMTNVQYYRIYQNGVFIQKAYNIETTCENLYPDTVYGFKVVAVGFYDNVLGEYSENIYLRTQKLPVAISYALSETSITAPANVDILVNTSSPESVSDVYVYLVNQETDSVILEGYLYYINTTNTWGGIASLGSVIPAGHYDLYVSVIDITGNSTQQHFVNVLTVKNTRQDTQPPEIGAYTVSTTAVTAPGTVEVTVAVTDNAGVDSVYGWLSHDGVDLVNTEVKFTRVSGTNNWKGTLSIEGTFQEGYYSIEIVAYDQNGFSDEIVIPNAFRVTNPNADTEPPSITFLFINQTTAYAPAKIVLTVNIDDNSSYINIAGGIGYLRCNGTVLPDSYVYLEHYYSSKRWIATFALSQYAQEGSYDIVIIAADASGLTGTKVFTDAFTVINTYGKADDLSALSGMSKPVALDDEPVNMIP